MGRRYSTRRGHPSTDPAWVVEYGALQVECRDEADAKKIAGRLRRKAFASRPTLATAQPLCRP
jgi:hypothetical protein